MRNDLTDADILAFCLGGCNAAEIAAFAGVSEAVAESWMTRVINSFAGTYPVSPCDVCA